jgi:hypothetical protein
MDHLANILNYHYRWPYDVKRMVFDGYGRRRINEVLGLRLDRCVFGVLWKRYRGLWYYGVVRGVGAKTYGEVALNLGITKQAVQSLAVRLGISRFIRRRFSILRNCGVSYRIKNDPGVLRAVDCVGRGVLIYGRVRRAVARARRRGYRNIRLVGYCDDPKREAFSLRFRWVGYRLEHEEPLEGFPGISPHKCGRLVVRYDRGTFLGYVVTLEEGIKLMRDYVLDDEKRPSQRGRCLDDTDGRRKKR